jgi:hypothetical protein
MAGFAPRHSRHVSVDIIHYQRHSAESFPVMLPVTCQPPSTRTYSKHQLTCSRWEQQRLASGLALSKDRSIRRRNPTAAPALPLLASPHQRSNTRQLRSGSLERSTASHSRPKQSRRTSVSEQILHRTQLPQVARRTFPISSVVRQAQHRGPDRLLLTSSNSPRPRRVAKAKQGRSISRLSFRNMRL